MTKLKSVFLLFLTAIIWGVAFVAQLIGSDHVGVFTFNGVRFILGALSLVPVILLFEQKIKIILNFKSKKEQKKRKNCFVIFAF